MQPASSWYIEVVSVLQSSLMNHIGAEIKKKSEYCLPLLLRLLMTRMPGRSARSTIFRMQILQLKLQTSRI